VFLASETVGTDRVLWPDRLWLAVAGTRAASLDASALGLGTLSLAGDGARGAAYAKVVHALKALPAAEKDARLAALGAALGEDPAPRPGPFRALTPRDVRGLAATGLAEFGGHSVTHDLLARQPDAEVARQVAESHAAAAAWSGRAPVAFAYPNGRPQDFDERARAAVRAAGIAWAFSTVQGACGPSSDPLALPRIGIGAGDSLRHVRLGANGTAEVVRAWRDRR
jgi:peptidoglycan/xylan/chitin deacetylase (PgdA/CDA1 family)